MTDKAQKILSKIAGAEDVAAKTILKLTGNSPHYGVMIPRGRVLRAIGSGLKTRVPTGPQYAPAETIADVLKKTTKTAGLVDETVDVLNSQQAGYRGVYDPRKRIKVAGVVDRSIAEINELQWGYRSMRNPYAEANSSSRNTNYMADYFAKQSSLIKIAIIRKEKDGYHIYGHSGKHLGGPYSEAHAKKRLQQIEYFKKQALFLDKFPKIRKGLATAMTAGALATPAKAGIGDLAKALEKEAPKLEATSLSRVHYHKPETAEAQRYVTNAGLKGPHWVTSDTTRTMLPTGAERRHIETFYFPQESGETMREVTKEVVNKKYPDLMDRESWLTKFDYDEAKKYLEMKKTLATK
jgi:hypothetical protein